MQYYIRRIFSYIAYYTTYKYTGQQLNAIFEKYLSMI